MPVRQDGGCCNRTARSVPSLAVEPLRWEHSLQEPGRGCLPCSASAADFRNAALPPSSVRASHSLSSPPAASSAVSALGMDVHPESILLRTFSQWWLYFIWVEAYQGGQWAGAHDVQRKAEEAGFAQSGEEKCRGGVISFQSSTS